MATSAFSGMVETVEHDGAKLSPEVQKSVDHLIQFLVDCERAGLSFKVQLAIPDCDVKEKLIGRKVGSYKAQGIMIGVDDGDHDVILTF